MSAIFKAISLRAAWKARSLAHAKCGDHAATTDSAASLLRKWAEPPTVLRGLDDPLDGEALDRSEPARPNAAATWATACSEEPARAAPAEVENRRL
jgi:hypothetical protein